MKIEEVRDLPSYERFLYWISERESIRKKKESGKPKPWTDDFILQTYKFCNVRRMDDRVSKWLLNNWYLPYKNHPNMLIACFIARIFNNPDVLEEIGFPDRFNSSTILKILKSRKAKGLKNFAPAYIVSTNGLEGDKATILVNRVLVPASKVKLAEIGTTSLELLSGHLTQLWGVSTFMSGQVSADVRHGVRGLWRDRRTWAPRGPGSNRGIQRLQGVSSDFKQINHQQFLKELRLVISQVDKILPEMKTRLEAIDYQNCLCEFDKYERTLWSQGRPKQKYPGVR